ncbi:hypothetical protein VTK26DRAFT_8094 [Humicola hyalothermophila]
MARPGDARSGDPLLKDYRASSDSEDNLPNRGRKSHRLPNRRTGLLPSSTTRTTTTTASSSTYLHPRTPTTTADSSPVDTRRTNLPTMTLHSHTISPPTGSTPSATVTTEAAAAASARQKYTLALVFLVICLASFTVQTELAAHIQHNLGWDKAYCMLYLTHSSWLFLWPCQLVVLYWLKGGGTPRGRGKVGAGWWAFVRKHVAVVRGIAQSVMTQQLVHGGEAGKGYYPLEGSGVLRRRSQSRGAGVSGRSPWGYLLVTTVGVTTALTIAGLSWYVAVSMTTPGDLTAIYNCSAFFAYAFSVPLLGERLRADKMGAVAVAIVGVLVVAYGDGGAGSESGTDDGADGGAGVVIDPARRLLGNLVIGVGSVLYGLYEVLYKRFACPPEGTDAMRGVIFANTFGSLIGAFTLLVLWIPLPVLHVLGWETFEVPTGQTAWLLFISVVMNMMFSGSFLVLISLTSPLLSSVAALLTIFIVAVVDWLWAGTPLSPAAVFGGLLIIAAFGMLSWSTWREMNEEECKKQVDVSSDEDD